VTDSSTAIGRGHAQELGVHALARLVSGTRAATIVLQDDRRIVYCNPAACQLLGQSLAQLRGRDILERVSADERNAMLLCLDPQAVSPDRTFTRTLRSTGEGSEREVLGATFVVQTDEAPLVVLTLWDLTEQLAAARTGAALAQTAARLVGSLMTTELLTLIARHGVEGTRARWCGFVVADENDRFTGGAGYGAGYGSPGHDGRVHGPGWAMIADGSAGRWVSAMTAGAIVIGGTPRGPVVLPDARARWNADPNTRKFAATLPDGQWEAGVCIPLAWQNRVIGLCNLTLPPGVTVLTESELAFLIALADQATLTVMSARLAQQARAAATLSERARLARDLHDSVSQSLFSMTMHASTAHLAMTMAGLEQNGPLARSLLELSELTRGALAEMRALIFELRPDALADEGLLAAMSKQATVLTARAGLAVNIEGPDRRIPMDAAIEEQLYRIACAALDNVVKHARATQVTVRIDADASTIWMTVTDDGVGFETQTLHPDQRGLSTMAERAQAAGARLTVASNTGQGTSVSIVAPLYTGGRLP
jgi:PAS domain S-box-containing protein